MSEPEGKTHSIALPGEWALRQAFGPVLGEIGEDIKRAYSAGRDKILAAGYRKLENPNDGRQANLRVTRDIMWNGAFADDEVCAEYFGGILASSRSEDGKDDSTIQFVDVIKSLSSRQLRLHYLIYNSLNKIFVATKAKVNVGLESEIGKQTVWLAAIELEEKHQINIETDFPIVFRQGLIKEYQSNAVINGPRAMPYCMAKPSTFGVLLYAAVHNQLADYRDFPRINFVDFQSIPSLRVFASSLVELRNLVGFDETEEVTTPSESH